MANSKPPVDPSVKGGMFSMWNSMRLEKIKRDQAEQSTKDSKETT